MSYKRDADGKLRLGPKDEQYRDFYEQIADKDAEIADYKTAMAGHKLREGQQDAEIARLNEIIEHGEGLYEEIAWLKEELDDAISTAREYLKESRAKDATIARLEEEVERLDRLHKLAAQDCRDWYVRYESQRFSLVSVEKENTRLQEENDMNAWKVSPAMAQAKIDSLNKALAAAEEREKRLREKVWAYCKKQKEEKLWLYHLEQILRRW